MKAHSLLLGIACAAASLTANVACGFSISSVTLSPSNVVPAMTELRMTIDIITPSQGTWLYAPTKVSSNSTGIRVDVFPGSGMALAIGALRETVNLGVFPIGTHHYEVAIHPEYPVNWGTRTNRGSFTVTGEDQMPRGPALEMVSPVQGQNFVDPEGIDIVVAAYHPTRDLLGVDFYADGRKLGESRLIFDKTVSGGLIVHRFRWSHPGSGPHVLTAQGYNENAELAAVSTPIRITVTRTRASLVITKPMSGARFSAGESILIEATALHLDGDVPRVEFLADGRQIGERILALIRPPDPGEPQTFSFVWRHPTPGSHSLTARATDDDVGTVVSAPVEIHVATGEPWPIVNVVARDAFAVEPTSNTELNTATFWIRRFGPTNEALVVNYSLHGTAENSVDYETLPGQAMIPPGQRSVRVTVRPLADPLVERIETVILRLEATSALDYRMDHPHHAMALIGDNPWVQPANGVQGVPRAGGWMHVCFTAENGHNFRVEATTDFQSWETVFDSVPSDGALHFVEDEMPQFPFRAYRVAPEPIPQAD